MKSSAELHVTGAHIVLEKLPPSAEIIGERHSSWVLHRHRCILKWVCSYPLRISDRLIDSWKSSDIRENGPLEGVSLSGEGLGREPVSDSTFAIVVPAMVLRSVTGFLEAIVQTGPDIVLQRGNAGSKLEDAEAIVGLRLLADGETVCINVCAPYPFERMLNFTEVGE